MNMKKVLTAGSSVAGVLGSAGVAFAQSGPGNLDVNPQDAGVKITGVGPLIESFIGGALLVAGLLVFAYLILGGIQWITSGGDKGKTEAARNKITAALIGLAIVASSYALMQVIGYFFGINIFDLGSTLDTIKPY